MRKAEKRMSCITAKLPDLLELYRSTGYMIPLDINDPRNVSIDTANKAIYVTAPVIDDILEKQKADEELLKTLLDEQKAAGNTSLPLGGAAS